MISVERSNLSERIGLGTAQFGLDYGISNTAGKMNEESVVRTMQVAAQAGVRVLDTAPAYGDAESIIGRMAPSVGSFACVTKTRQLRHGLDAVIDGVAESLARLGPSPLYGLLVHAAGDLLGPEGQGLWRALADFRESGRVLRIGASVYTTEDANALMDRYPLDIIQIPFSMIDQRFLSDGTLARLNESGVEVHARSVFLQGLMFLNPVDLPPELAFAVDHLAHVHGVLSKIGVSPLTAAVNFVLHRPEIDMAIIGVTGESELQEVINAAGPQPDFDWQSLATNDPRIVLPANWVAQQ